MTQRDVLLPVLLLLCAVCTVRAQLGGGIIWARSGETMVLEAACSPDGSMIAGTPWPVSDGMMTVFIWDVASGRVLGCVGEAHDISAVSLPTGGTRLAVATWGGDVGLLDPRGHDSSIWFGRLPGRAIACGITADGAYLVAVDENGNGAGWDAATRARIAGFKAPEAARWHVVTSTVTPFVAVRGTDSVRAWNGRTGGYLGGVPIPGGSSPPAVDSLVAVDITDARLALVSASAGRDSAVIDTYELPSLRRIAHDRIAGDGFLQRVAVGRGGRICVMVRADSFVVVDLDNGVRRTMPMAVSPTFGPAVPLQMVISPTGHAVFNVHQYSPLEVGRMEGIFLDSNRKEPYDLFFGHRVEYRPDGRSIVTTGASFSASSLIASDGIRPARLALPGPDGEEFLDVSPDGAYVLATHAIWHADSGVIARPSFNCARITDGGAFAVGRIGDSVMLMYDRFRDHIDTIHRRYSRFYPAPHGALIAAVDFNRNVDVMRLPDSTVLARIHDDSANIKTAAFSDDGTQLAIAYDDRSVHIVDVATGSVRLRFKPSAAWCTALRFNPRSGLLLIATFAGGIFACDPSTGAVVHSYGVEPRFWGSIYDLAVSPDGHTLLAAGSSGALIAFDLDGGSSGVEAPRRKPTMPSRRPTLTLRGR